MASAGFPVRSSAEVGHLTLLFVSRKEVTEAAELIMFHGSGDW